jgi:hypothetical protein
MTEPRGRIKPTEATSPTNGMIVRICFGSRRDLPVALIERAEVVQGFVAIPSEAQLSPALSAVARAKRESASPEAASEDRALTALDKRGFGCTARVQTGQFPASVSRILGYG